MQNRRTSKFLVIPVFVAAIGVSPAVLAQGTNPNETLSNTRQYIDDTAITTKIKAALVADSQVKATQVSVETKDGVVQLSGTVDSKKAESEALRVANQVDGVKSVKDLLSVRGTQEE